MIKVLHIGKFFPPPYGGMESVLVDLIDQLSGSVQADVLVANRAARSETLQYRGARVWKIPSLGRMAGTSICPSMPLALRRLAGRNAYDVIHLHLPNPMAHAATWFCRSGVPLVITWHSDIIRQRRLLRLYQPLVDRLVARAAAIVAATPKHFASSRQLTAARDPSRRWVVPFGIDPRRFARTDQVQSEVDRIRGRFGGRRIIFAVGRHVGYKGFEYLIRAMAELHGTQLLLGGSGPLTPALEQLARETRVVDRVEFTGSIDPEALPAHYHAADVCCMPSVGPNEAFGMVQLEAMACGKPVVCCELHNGVTHVNQHGVTGLVVAPRNPAALAGALRTLLEDPALRESMGRAAFNRVVREYSFDRMRAGMLDVYRAVLSRAQPAEAPGVRRAA